MILPIVLSGGAGTRLWPVSRESHPKPFIKLPDGQSLLQKSLQRANLLASNEILCITNQDYFYKTKQEFERLSSAQSTANLSFLLEPFAKNTGPAILLAALYAEKNFGPDTVLFIMPADHIITDEVAFLQAFAAAKKWAAAGKLVTLGIVPTEPQTAFGYIECGYQCDADGNFNVNRFVEKPELAAAQSYLASGNYLWNSGMFCFTAQTLLSECLIHAPSLYASIKTCWMQSKAIQSKQPSAIEIDSAHFQTVPNISIDYALIEKSANVVVIPTKFEWNDVGSWDRMVSLSALDEHGNNIAKNAIHIDTNNTYIYGTDRMVAAVGINNLLIIDTPDALLVADRNAAQDVKKVVQALKQDQHETYKSHNTMIRPWGYYTVLEESALFKIKRIVVNIGGSLSLQKHQHRSEHWVVIAGRASIVNGDKEVMLSKNESTFIPAGNKHRLTNIGTEELILIEVQTGSYLGEDDIVRYDDIYGRAKATA